MGPGDPPSAPRSAPRQKGLTLAPFNLPWSTFGAFLVLIGTIILALVWAAVDRHNEKRHDDNRQDDNRQADKGDLR